MQSILRLGGHLHGAWTIAGETVRANAMETIQARRAKSARLDFLVKRASAIAIPRNIAPEEAGARRRVNVSATSGLRERGARIVLHPSTGQNAKPNARMSNVAWTGHVRMTGPASAARVSRGKDVMLVLDGLFGDECAEKCSRAEK